MTNELEKETVVEPQTPTEPEVKVDSEPTPDPIKSLETRVAELDKGLKTAHQTITQKDKALKEQQDLRGLISDVRIQMEMTRAFLGEVSTQRSDDIPEEGEKPKGVLDTKLKEIETKSREAQLTEMATEVASMFEGTDLNPNTSKELETVRLYFGYGTPDMARKGVAVAQELADKIKSQKEAEIVEVKEEAPKETEAQIRSRIEKEVWDKMGYKPEVGLPVTGNESDDDLIAKAGAGDDVDFDKLQAALQKKFGKI